MNVYCEKYIFLLVEQSLGMLAGATLFSELDANMRFWQISLTEESVKYTTVIALAGTLWTSMNSEE